jgi:methanogenic corrinoid protein MtbC1
LLLDILRPALWELGDRWARGTVSVAQEKEVSEVVRELITEVTARHSGRIADHAIGLVAACVAGEAHELGLRMVSGLLRAFGLDVHYLGTNVAPAFLVDAIQRRQPCAVLLSVTGDEHLPALGEAVLAIRAAGNAPRLLAGGQAVVRQPEVVAGYGVTPILDGFDAIVAALAIGEQR